MSEAHAAYLGDLCLILRENAVEARDVVRQNLGAGSVSPGVEGFNLGYAEAYRDILRFMVNYAKGYGIPDTDLAMKDWDPDHELIP